MGGVRKHGGIVALLLCDFSDPELCGEILPYPRSPSDRWLWKAHALDGLVTQGNLGLLCFHQTHPWFHSPAGPPPGIAGAVSQSSAGTHTPAVGWLPGCPEDKADRDVSLIHRLEEQGAEQGQQRLNQLSS